MIGDLPEFDAHEGVHLFHDSESGLRAVVAVHSTHLGPAAGGTRFWHYASESLMVRDALRLSRAMSYKNAMAGLDLGGGKGVILRPEGTFDRTALFEAYGRALEACGGTYYTAEDVGVGTEDMDVISQQTDYVTGTSAGGGDPSPWTAMGVYLALEETARFAGLGDVAGLRVAVQGLGSVGYALAERLSRAGATLHVADIEPSRVEQAVKRLSAEAVPPEHIHAADVDIFAPCALNHAVNSETVENIRAKVICGGANNQLASGMGAVLQQRGIVWAPDYVVNAGGIINVASELRDSYDPEWTRAKVEAIPMTLHSVLERAKDDGRPPGEVADEMARDRIGRA